MQKLLILASGEGTRNAYLTYNNAMPKCLLSVGDKTCLEAIIDSYQTLVEKVYIACLSKHAKLIDDLLRFRGYHDYTICSFKAQPSAIKSLETAIALIPSFAEDEWYINWSDVFVKKMPELYGNCIVTDKQIRHRNYAYHVNNKLIGIVGTAKQEGNVPGIFHARGSAVIDALQQNYKTGMMATQDFDVALRHAYADNLALVQLPDIIDIGDYGKYSKYMRTLKSENTCRYFNELKVERQIVLKRPKTEQGVKLHQIELAYYREFANGDIAMPKLLGYDSETMTMTLERVKGQTCQSYVDSKVDINKATVVNNLIKKFNKAIATIHALPIKNKIDTEADISAAIVDEFYSKINGRVMPCMAMIDNVITLNEIRSVDGMPISSYEHLQDAVCQWLKDMLGRNAFSIGITHGDPNTDNTMYTQDGLMFVDPRGYFGKLKTLGLGVKQYDLAKFAYGFSGYSKFNSAEYISMQINNNNVNFFVGAEERPGITDVSIFDMNINDDIKVMIGIIWVKLTSYIINDPIKSVAAYLYGNALLTKLLDIKRL